MQILYAKILIEVFKNALNFFSTDARKLSIAEPSSKVPIFILTETTTNNMLYLRLYLAHKDSANNEENNLDSISPVLQSDSYTIASSL